MKTPDGNKDFSGLPDDESKVVTVRYFFFENEASIYAARLQEVGIPAFLSNTNSSTVLLGGTSSIGLNVRESDLDAAKYYLAELDENARTNELNEDFRDADRAEIDYQRSLHERIPFYRSPFNMFLLLIVLLLVVRAFLRAAGLLPVWLNPF
ncbi:MAG: hypothetical protein AAFO94_16135 [Bacteroidota bacterium]